MTATDVGSDGLTNYREVAIEELIENYDIVDVKLGTTLADRSFMVVSERPITLAKQAIDPSADMKELGYTSMSPWTAWTREERLPQLRDKLGVRQYYDMKRNDGTIRGALGLLKTPIRAARWFFEPGSNSTTDQNVSDFLSDNLFKNLNVDWAQVLDDILLMFDYGYMVFEKVYKFDDKGKVQLRKLAPRHPLDIQEWIFDDRGGPAGILMEPFVPYGNRSISFPFVADNPQLELAQFIPISKLVIFSLEAEAGDLRGTSVLRSAYKHWYYKDTLYKIDAIQKERHGIGIPVIKLPPGFSKDDKELANELGRNLRTNDRAHIVIPSNWEILFAKLEGQPVSAIESIDHHDNQIHANIIAPFMGSDSPTDQAIDMFFKSTRYLADTICNVVNKFIIPELVDFNFSRAKYPKLRARRIGEWNDLRTWSFAFRNLVGSSAIVPDDPLELFLRDELDLPKPDPTTARIVATPQGPGGGGDANTPKAPTPPKVGPPRQAKASANPLKGNSGRDSSGG